MAKGISRVDKDSAGGKIVGVTQRLAYCEGYIISVVPDPIQPHGSGPHVLAVMATGSVLVYAEGYQVCRKDDKASCGDKATGSSFAFADDD